MPTHFSSDVTLKLWRELLLLQREEQVEFCPHQLRTLRHATAFNRLVTTYELEFRKEPYFANTVEVGHRYFFSVSEAMEAMERYHTREYLDALNAGERLRKKTVTAETIRTLEKKISAALKALDESCPSCKAAEEILKGV